MPGGRQTPPTCASLIRHLPKAPSLSISGSTHSPRSLPAPGHPRCALPWPEPWPTLCSLAGAPRPSPGPHCPRPVHTGSACEGTWLVSSATEPPTGSMMRVWGAGGLENHAGSFGVAPVARVCGWGEGTRPAIPMAHVCGVMRHAPSRRRAHARLWRGAHRTASVWSLSSRTPSRRRTSCRSLVPWKPLPRPSHFTTTAPWLLTITVSQFTSNFSATLWLPGVPSLQRTGWP